MSRHERRRLFDIERDVVSTSVLNRRIDDGRTGLVCTVNFIFNGEERYISFLLVSRSGNDIRLDRVEGGGGFPGDVVGLVRDFAKRKVAEKLYQRPQ